MISINNAVMKQALEILRRDINPAHAGLADVERDDDWQTRKGLARKAEADTALLADTIANIATVRDAWDDVDTIDGAVVEMEYNDRGVLADK